MPINGKTYVGVPGYDSKVQFGVMSYFAYPVDGAGESTLSDSVNYSWLLRNM